MIRRFLLPLAAILSSFMLISPAMAAGDGIHCSFSDGFANVATLIPTNVGACLGDPIGLGNGDVAQQTTEGQMLWTKADNLSRFISQGLGTTWVLGPQGLQSRPNDQRFSYEAPTSNVAGVSIVRTQPNTGIEPCLVNLLRGDGMDRPNFIQQILPLGNPC